MPHDDDDDDDAQRAPAVMGGATVLKVGQIFDPMHFWPVGGGTKCCLDNS